MGDIIQTDFSGLNLPASITDGYDAAEDESLTGGVESSLAIVGFRGKVWRIKCGGEETMLMNAEGDPLNSLRVIMLDASEFVSRTYYKASYAEGDKEAPDCAALDGISPDRGVSNPQSAKCATCPQDQFGSRINDNGKEAKACSAVRRVAVVPSGDIANEIYGGPMLLRVPGESARKTLKDYGEMLRKRNIPPFGIVTKVSFDPSASFPKLMFSVDVEATQRLGDDDYAAIVGHREGSAIKQVLGMRVDAPDKAPQTEAEAPRTEVEAPKKAPPKPRAKAKPRAKKKVEPAEPAPARPADPDEADVTVIESVPTKATDADVDDLLGDLLGG